MQVTRSTLRLRILGSPSLTDEAGKSPPSLGWGKPLALLSFLAVRHEARRDEIVDLLWRDMEPDKARNTFRQALHRLRTALGEDILPLDRELIRLMEHPGLSIDLVEFERAASAGRVPDALRLYSGDFLENTEIGETAFDLWAERERQRIRGRLRQLLHDAVQQASAAGNSSDAIAASRRLLAVAPYDAHAAELAAKTLLAAGRAGEAREMLRSFGQRLDAELGVTMPPEVKALYARLQRQDAGEARGAPRAPTTDFAGREAELTRLMALWRETAEDSGTLAIVEAGVGLGKSRLARELVANVRAIGGALVLAGRERPVGAQLPLGVFAEALRPLVRAPGIAGTSRHLLAEAARLLPELRDQFDLPAIADVDDEAARLRFFEGLGALVDAAAYEQPVLLVIEDGHRLPPSSLDLLSYLCARLAGSAVMLVVTSAPLDESVTGARLRALIREHRRAEHLQLAPLAREASFASVERAARDSGIPEQALARIVEQSAGNPAHLAELLRRTIAGESVGTALVSWKELGRERLQRLTSAQRRVLLVLAMIGRPVPGEVAAQAAHVSTNAAGELVASLVSAGLVEDDGAAVQVQHEISDLVLQSADVSTKTFLSGWIADALAALPDASPFELARFHGAAGQPDRAFRESRRAAFMAIGLGAVDEGVQYLRMARAFATSDADVSDIESLLGAAGAGRIRLPSASPVAAATADATHLRADAPGGTRPSRPETVGRLVPNWRFLLGAAVATLAISAVVLAPRSGLAPASPLAASDTLVVTEDAAGRTVRFATGNLSAGFALSPRAQAPSARPAWADSLDVETLASPTGQHVALHVPREGGALALLTADRRDTTLLGDFGRAARAMAWSPDGRWLLLASPSRTGGANDTELWAVRVAGGVRIALDTARLHAVTEAAWSPDGSRIAWVAQTGDARQSEVYVALADGTRARNVSRHPADDYRIAWSGDGELLAFTSMRDGNAELYAASVLEPRLWRLTRDAAQDDRAAFSTSGRLIAFESTRGGVAGVHVMPALGGEPVRVGSAADLSVVGWRGPGGSYVDRVRVNAAGIPAPGDSVVVRALAFDREGDPLPAPATDWHVIDTTLAYLVTPADSSAPERVLVARRAGLARVIASVGGWRADTAVVRVGHEAMTLLDFPGTAGTVAVWQPFGAPSPVSVAGEFVLRADDDWESGVLSAVELPLVPGLGFQANLELPLRTGGDAPMSASVALVAPDEVVDDTEPQFLRYASFAWNAQADRFVYAVGREVHAEPTGALAAAGALAVTLTVMPDSTVTFRVNGVQRWRSTLRVINPRYEATARVWVGARATGDAARLRRASALLAATASSP